MHGPYGFEKTTRTVADLQEDDRFYIGGLMYKVLGDPLTNSVNGEVQVRMYPVFVDFLPDITVMTLPGRNPIEIHNQPA